MKRNPYDEATCGYKCQLNLSKCSSFPLNLSSAGEDWVLPL